MNSTVESHFFLKEQYGMVKTLGTDKKSVTIRQNGLDLSFWKRMLYLTVCFSAHAVNYDFEWMQY